MANLQVRIKGGLIAGLVLDRIPSAGEYIAGKSALLVVQAVIFTPEAKDIDAVLFAAKDADGKPDELGLFPSHF